MRRRADGILLVNLGTPAAPTAAAVRSYLAEFLSDPRVVELPRLLWWPILHGIVLRLRPARSAARQPLAIRRNSSWTSGINWLRAAPSPFPQSTRSFVTWRGWI